MDNKMMAEYCLAASFMLQAASQALFQSYEILY